ncbi:MAG: GNAT family N-acetyltransferase [Bacteroidota bacterium]
MSNKERYREICKGRTDVQAFAQPWWLDAVCPEWDVAIAMKGEHVAGAWPYPIEKKLGIPLLRTPLLTPYLGPQVFLPADIKGSRADSYEHETIAALMQQMPQAKVWHLSVQPGIRQAGLFKKHHLYSHVQQTFVVGLKENEETLLANMKDVTRRNIRQAESEIVITNEPGMLGALFAFQQHTMSKKNCKVPYTLTYLQGIMDAAMANDAAALWVAKDKAGTVHAIVWQVADHQCSYYFMGAQNPESTNYKAMSLLLWHTIKEAKRRGNTCFDLEGSMDEGVERFFRNFGGDRQLYIVLQKNKSVLWKLKQALLG